MAKLIVAAVQMDSKDNKVENIKQATDFIDKTVDKGAKLIVLPEVFNYIGVGSDEIYQGESIPGYTTGILAQKAVEHNCWIAGGSILEKVSDEEKVYNTSFVLSPTGELTATYRKIHLFDVEVEDGPSSMESAYRKEGSKTVSVNIEDFNVGLTICYDLRFPELFRALTLKGANVIIVSAYFSKGTGKDHWHSLLRARAIENQVYIIAANQTGDKVPFSAYGHSMIIDPWGKIISEMDEETGIVLAELDLDYLKNVRKQVPCLNHIKQDLLNISRI